MTGGLGNGWAAVSTAEQPSLFGPCRTNSCQADALPTQVLQHLSADSVDAITGLCRHMLQGSKEGCIPVPIAWTHISVKAQKVPGVRKLQHTLAVAIAKQRVHHTRPNRGRVPNKGSTTQLWMHTAPAQYRRAASNKLLTDALLGYAWRCASPLAAAAGPLRLLLPHSSSAGSRQPVTVVSGLLHQLHSSNGRWQQQAVATGWEVHIAMTNRQLSWPGLSCAGRSWQAVLLSRRRLSQASTCAEAHS